MMSTLILRTGARVIVPLSLVFAFYIYLKGHQTPGGGFVAGLVASVALVVYRMSEGGERIRRLLPVSERVCIAAGLLLVLATGTAALTFGLPFLTSNHGHNPLPADYEWATVMLFDAGVFLVVAGVVVGMINALLDEHG